MAMCRYCNRDMLKAKGCIPIPVILKNGKTYQPLRFGSEDGHGSPGERCGDCNAFYGEYHHPGCDNERCPVCGGQAISCDCIIE